MRKLALFLLIVSLLISADYGNLADELKEHRTCQICGMDRQKHAQSRMLLTFDNKTSAGTCSIRCSAAEMAAHRERTITNMMVSDYLTGKLIAAEKAVWIIGGDRAGVMTGRAKWAFEAQASAEKFIKEHGGKLAVYDEAMKAAFADMAGEVTMPQSRKPLFYAKKNDIQAHPECRYCGMDRKVYDYSRMLVVNKDAAETGTCSIHCTAINLALNPGKSLQALWAGDYGTKKLINAQRAYWVLGGDRKGVMSIRGKWAFERKKDAAAFMKDHGGRVGSFKEALPAAFEDMWEILR